MADHIRNASETGWKISDALHLTYMGRTVDAVVIMASRDGRSLMLAFDAMLGGYVATMPVFLDTAGRWIELLGQREVLLRKKLEA